MRLLGPILERAVRTHVQTYVAVLVTIGLGLGRLPVWLLALAVAFVAAALSVVTSLCATAVGGEPAITESPSEGKTHDQQG